jgi:Chlorophyll A-B binding protein
VAAVEEEAAPAAPAAPSYVKSRSLPFLEYPPNLAGYVGDAGFDPFRCSDFVPMDFLREAEIKHGRITMLAIVGFAAVDLGLRVYPTPEAYEGLTSVTAHDALVEQGAMGQLLLWFSMAEIVSSIAVVQMMEGSGREPGYFGFDPLRFMNAPKEKQDDWKLRELTNGRLAMMAFSGMVRYTRGFEPTRRTNCRWPCRLTLFSLLVKIQVTQAVLTQGPFPYV